MDEESQGVNHLPLCHGRFSKQLKVFLADTLGLPFTAPGRLMRFSVIAALELCPRVSQGSNPTDRIRFSKEFLTTHGFTSGLSVGSALYRAVFQ